MDLKELEAIASKEMTKYGLQGWSFRFAQTKRQLGVCKYRKKRIEIAEYERWLHRPAPRAPAPPVERPRRERQRSGRDPSQPGSMARLRAIERS